MQPNQRQLHLLYHELRSSAAMYSYVVTTALFQQHVELCAGLIASGSRVEPVITFDDGHSSNFTLAAPVLSSRHLTGHFFITVGWVASRMGYMDWSQLSALVHSGHAIGAHGWSHTLLTHCTPAQLDMELRRSRLVLEDKLGIRITTMSLPGGRSNRRVMEACREAGYTHVYTSIPRAEPVPSGPSIGRVNIQGNTSAEWLAQLFKLSSPQLARLNRSYHVKAAAKLLVGDGLYGRIWGILNRQEADIDSGIPSEPRATEAASSREPSA